MNQPGIRTFRRAHVWPLSMLALAALVALVLSPLAALAQTTPEPIQVSGTPVLVSGGPGNQTDPHISGTLISYTNESSVTVEIRYHDLATGSDAGIPTAGHRDGLSDVRGTTIMFRRIYTDGSTASRPIMAFDTANPAAGPVEINPVEGARRRTPAIGGRTVAWIEEVVGGIANLTDVVAYDLDSGQATRLTTDGADMSNRDPAVSQDGAVVTWGKCLPNGTVCDVYAVRKNADGTWGAATRIGDDTGNDIQPDTNGQVIVYASNVAGDFDIRWVNVDGTGERQLPMPGQQSRPNMSGSLIAFESAALGTTNRDLFIYDLATELLYQVTNTPDVDEFLNDIAVAPDGSVQVVWAQLDGLQAGDYDVYATSFELSASTSYEICPLFDQSRPYRLKSIVLIPLQLCDAQGENLSSPDLVVTATELVKADGASATVKDVGNLNPDRQFRYLSWLGRTGGYAFVLNTKGLSKGTWELRFTVGGDSTTYSVAFNLR